MSGQKGIPGGENGIKNTWNQLWDERVSVAVGYDFVKLKANAGGSGDEVC